VNAVGNWTRTPVVPGARLAKPRSRSPRV
jgi:hypothetical protein